MHNAKLRYLHTYNNSKPIRPFLESTNHRGRQIASRTILFIFTTTKRRQIIKLSLYYNVSRAGFERSIDYCISKRKSISVAKYRMAKCETANNQAKFFYDILNS